MLHKRISFNISPCADPQCNRDTLFCCLNRNDLHSNAALERLSEGLTAAQLHSSLHALAFLQHGASLASAPPRISLLLSHPSVLSAVCPLPRKRAKGFWHELDQPLNSFFQSGELKRILFFGYNSLQQHELKATH